MCSPSGSSAGLASHPPAQTPLWGVLQGSSLRGQNWLATLHCDLTPATFWLPMPQPLQTPRWGVLKSGAGGLEELAEKTKVAVS